MGEKPIGLSGRCGFALLALTVVALPVAVFAGGIDLPTFLSIGALWLVVSAAMIFGHDITEITLWKASIKRDVTAAKQAREEVEAIRDQIRKVSAVTVENSYILSGELLLLVKHLTGDQNLELARKSPGMKRLFANMNEVWKFVEPDQVKAELLRQQVRKDLGMKDE